MNKQSLHQIVQIIIAILTALATSLTAQSCIKQRKARMTPKVAAIMVAPHKADMQKAHDTDIKVLVVTDRDTACVATVCNHH